MSGSRWLCLLLTTVILIPSVAAADQRGPFRGDVGALGMGNTGVAVPGRGCLWIYNPAVLTTVDFELAIPSIDLGANGKTLELFDYLDDQRGNFADWDNLSAPEKTDVLDDGSDLFRKTLGFRTAPLVGFAQRNLGLALYADTRADVVMVRNYPDPLDAAPAVNGFFHTDVVAQIGTAGIALDPLSIGITVRYVNRRANRVTIDPNDLDEVLSTISEDPESYHGWGVDLGAYYPTGFWNLSVGASFRNLLGGIQVPAAPATKSSDDEEKETDSFYRNLAVGASWQPVPKVLLTADIEDLLNQVDDLEFGDQIHVGAELDMMLLRLRTGMFRGSLTYGVGLSLLFFNIDFATYVPGSDRPELTEDEERVYVGQFKFGWQ